MTKSSMSLFGKLMRSCTCVDPLGVALGHAKADDERHSRVEAARDLLARQQIAAAIVLEASLRAAAACRCSRARPAVQKHR